MATPTFSSMKRRNSVTQNWYTNEAIANIGRVSPDMPLTEIIAKLAEHGVRAWDIKTEHGLALFFVGEDSAARAAEVYQELYKDLLPPAP